MMDLNPVFQSSCIIERMQVGRSSDGFDGGVLSPYWDPVQQYFARLVRDAIAASSNIES